MAEGICIYCKKDKGLNKEHAFPNSLLQKCAPLSKCAPEWIIEKLCEDCNNATLGKLDKVLVTRSPIAFIWRAIKTEWMTDKIEKQNKSQDSSFYNAKAYGIDPVRLFYPDPLYENRIVLHEELGASAHNFCPTSLARAQAPQMILTLYTEGQTPEQVIAEHCEKWDADTLLISKSDIHEGIYCIAGNTYIFPPKATRYFVSNLDREREFMSKFMKTRGYTQYCLNILSPDNRKDYGKISGFYKRLRATTKLQIEAEKFEPKESTANLMILADQEAKPYINRAIAKIAFHCFLYWHPEFSGHEPIFEEIRAFVLKSGNHQTSNGEDFVTGLNVRDRFVWPSHEHFHIFRFYENGDNIICQIVFFTGLSLNPSRSETPEPLASEIILAGHSQKARFGRAEERGVPFYVHGKSQLKRRIIPV